MLIILSLLYLAIPLLLFSLRSFDDNTLVSWSKVFRHASALRVYLTAAACVPAAWVLSRFRGPGPGGLFVLAFAFGSMFWMEPEVIVDASRYAMQAKHLELYGLSYFISEWGREIFAWTDMPLMPMLYGLVLKVSGESRVAVQVLNTGLFAGAVALTSLIGRDLYVSHDGMSNDEEGPVIGDTAGALLLAMPYLYTQVPLLMVDVGSMFFLLLSVWTFVRALRHGGVYIPVAAVTATAVVFSKYSLWLMLSVHGVLLLMHLRETPAVVLRRCVGVVLFSAVLTGTVLLYYQDVVEAQVRLLFTYQREGLKRWGESFTSTFLFQMHPLIILCALYSFWAAIRRADMRYIALAWLVVLLVGVLQVRRIRYLMPVFPWIALMAAYGLSRVRSARVRRFTVTAAILMSLSLAFLGYLKFFNVNNLVNVRDAGAYLETLDTHEVTVLTYPQKSKINPAIAVPLLDLYTEKPLRYEYLFRTHLSRKQVKRSSFRFTWEYRNPRYYEDHGNVRGRFITVIAPGMPGDDDPRLEGYELVNSFEVSEGFYRFKPFIYVYREIIDKSR